MSTDPAQAAPATAGNAAQIEYWNATAGANWAAFQTQLDRQLEPLGAAGIRALAPSPGARILDIGCGCGQTSFALAAQVGPEGAVLGVDISEPMLAVAEARPRPPGGAAPRFRLADAAAEAFAPGGFDAAYSRFGVMFFSDPASAFANIRRALKPQGRLAFVCWRPLTENPWMQVPMEAARPLLPPAASTPSPAEPMAPGAAAPGPFAFADPAHVTTILTEAGFQSVTATAFDAPIGSGGLEETVALCRRVGPLGAALREHPDRAEAVLGVVREALSAYLTPEGVFMPAAVWVMTATAQ